MSLGKTPDYQSTSYTDHADQIALVDAVFNGVDKAVDYLTQFPREENEPFEDRKDKATLKNFVKRSSEGIRNIIFRKSVDYGSLPVSMEKYLKTIDNQDTVNEFAKTVTLSLIKHSKTYILIDSPRDNGTIVTKEDEKAAGIRPYMLNVTRDRIVNYRKDSKGNFTQVSIAETYTEETNLFSDESKTQYRVLYSDGRGQIWREQQTDEFIVEYVVVDEWQTDLDYIPLVEISIGETPMMYDVAKMNVKHLNRRSNLDRYLDIAGLPVPVIWGAQDKDSNVVIGVDQAILFNSKDEGDFQWREITGDSTESLNKDLNELERAMLEETIRLASEGEGNKTATEARYEATETEGRLTNLAQAVEAGLNKAYEYFCDYLGIKPVGEMLINRDFSSNIMDSQQVTSILNLYTQGAISLDTLWTELEKGEVIDIEDKEKEKLLIDNLGGE